MQIDIPRWKQLLRTNFVELIKLADHLQLSEAQRIQLLERPRFVLNLPKRIADKINKNDLNDPLLKQFLPLKQETVKALNFVEDPVGDSACRKGHKLLHKYQGRVLLVCTSACAMHCRYCFRQNFDYHIEHKGFAEELQLIAEDPLINEVILSGGDPLSLDNRILSNLITDLALIPHLKKVRFHTRFPIGIPERIDEGFLDILQSSRLQIWFVIHSNHARELDDDVLAALKRIQKLGIPVLNQAVLLKGVNDCVDVLVELFSLLVDYGIQPYYLHQLDRVQGTSHFEVDEMQGKKLMEAIAQKLPGYAVPRYVKEIPGMPGKMPIG